MRPDHPLLREDDYRLCLKELAERERARPEGENFQGLAARMRIAKSYLSKVFAQRAHLSSDQAYLACQVLRLPQDEAQLFLLLLEFGRSGVRERKTQLKQEIDRIRAESLEVRSQLSNVAEAPASTLEEYYLDPWLQLIHVALAIPTVAASPRLLSHHLQMPQEKVRLWIDRLEQLNVIRKTPEGYDLQVRRLHLPREDLVYPSWRSQVRIMALQKLQTLSRSEGTSVSVFFAASPQAAEAIRKEFLSVLARAEKWAMDAEKTSLYQLNFDLFPWFAE